jgi:hypothetical protein
MMGFVYDALDRGLIYEITKNGCVHDAKCAMSRLYQSACHGLVTSLIPSSNEIYTLVET